MAISTGDVVRCVVDDQASWGHRRGSEPTPAVIGWHWQQITLGEVVDELVYRLEEDDDNALVQYLHYLAWGGPLGQEPNGNLVADGLGLLPIEEVDTWFLGDQVAPIIWAFGEERANTALLAASFLFDFAIAKGYLDAANNPARWLLGLESDD